MLQSEMAELLTVARSVDRREVTPLMVAGWMEVCAGLDYAEARAALAEHHATSTEPVKPAHVLAIAHEARRREAALAPADHERRSWMRQHGIDWAAWERGDEQARRHADAVARRVLAGEGKQ